MRYGFLAALSYYAIILALFLGLTCYGRIAHSDDAPYPPESLIYDGNDTEPAHCVYTNGDIVCESPHSRCVYSEHRLVCEKKP